MSVSVVTRRLRRLLRGAAWFVIWATLLPWVATGQEVRKESAGKQATNQATAPGASDAQRWLSSVQDVLAGAIDARRPVVSIAD